MKRQPPPTFSAVGWGTYVWASAASTHWLVGKWSACSVDRAADAMWQAWRGGECEMTQKRSVRCQGSVGEGEVWMSDFDCLEHSTQTRTYRCI